MIETKRNLSLLMDFYELTMSNGYFIDGKENQLAAFDMFYRNNPDDAAYSIFCGLSDVIDFIEDLHFEEDDIEYLSSLNIFDRRFLDYLKNFRFKGDVYSFKEGSIVYPNEPLITVVAPLIDCQLLETAMLLIVNHETLIATKANRIVLASKGRGVSDFGARRAHNIDAALFGAKASYIGGVGSTATTLAGKMFSIPVSGTMAHSYVMSYKSAYESFLAYAKVYPENTVLLIDTYNVIHSGIVNAIRVEKEFLRPNGYHLKGVRIDSGDLAYLSKKIRKILDDNDMKETKIIVSNSLDEFKIESLLSQGAMIDAFGVGENLITSKSNPVFGGVYKLVAIEEEGILKPRIKISETIEKITNPGLKEVYRVYSKADNKAIADLLTIKGEEVHDSYHFVDPNKPWKDLCFDSVIFKKMHECIYKNGKLLYTRPSIEETRKYVRDQVNNELWDEEKRFVLPHLHYLDFSRKLYELKLSLMKEFKYE